MSDGYERLIKMRARAIAAARACPPMSATSREREAALFPSGGRSAPAGPGPRGDRGYSSLAPATPRPPATAGTSPPVGGGGGAFDARDASPEQIERRLALLGVSLPPDTLDEHANKRRGSTVNEVALRLAEAQAQKRDRGLRTERERASKAIDEAARSGEGFSARDASVDEVRAQLAELGVRDPVITDSFKPHGKALEPPRPPPVSKAEQERERRDNAILGAAREGRPVDARELSGGGLQRLLRARGLLPTPSWPVMRTPSRR